MNNINVLLEEHEKWVDTAGKSGKQLSLDCIDMRSFSLQNPFLEQGFFSECDFSGLSFDSINFYQSEFYSCNFSNSHFANCDFRKATLDYNNFFGASFTNCKFSKTDAFKTNFDNCEFVNCSFVGFNLMEGSIIGAKIETTDFEEAYFNKVCSLNAKIINPLNEEKINHISIYFNNSNDLLEGNIALKSLEGNFR